MITLRLQRVTFLALHDYLGLSRELINPEAMTSLKRSSSRSGRRFSLSESGGPTGSPTHGSDQTGNENSTPQKIRRKISIEENESSDLDTPPKKRYDSLFYFFYP